MREEGTQNETYVAEQDIRSQKDHKHGLTAVLKWFTLGDITANKLQIHFYAETEAVLQRGDETVKTNNSCTLKCSADSSHLI